MKLKQKPSLPLPYHSILVKDIILNERFRKDYGDIAQLAENISKRGLLHPLIISREKYLLAGGRRYTAIVQLKWDYVDCHYIDEVDELTAREIELAENLLRKNLSWQEQAKLSLEIERIGELKYGKGHAGPPIRGGSDEENLKYRGWTTMETAKARGVSYRQVRRDLALAAVLEVIPSLENEKSADNAARKIRRLEEDIVRELYLRSRSKEAEQLSSNVIAGDATSLITNLGSGSVDCIITDPPYGDDNWTGGERHRTEKEFDDSPESVFAMLRSIGPELRRVLKPDGHFYSFFSTKWYQQSIDIWKHAGFNVRDVICIWHKIGGATGTVNWDKDYAPAWEPFLFAHNGERSLKHKRENVFDYAPPSQSERLHPNQKPVSLICELINQSTEPGDLILDPFGGAGSVAIAAHKTKRRFITYENNERFVAIIKQRILEEVRNEPVPTNPEDLETSAIFEDDNSGEPI